MCNEESCEKKTITIDSDDTKFLEINTTQYRLNLDIREETDLIKCRLPYITCLLINYFFYNKSPTLYYEGGIWYSTNNIMNIQSQLCLPFSSLIHFSILSLPFAKAAYKILMSKSILSIILPMPSYNYSIYLSE